MSRLSEQVANRVPHLMDMASGEAYISLCLALKEEISERFGGSLENLFILETYRHMAPNYSDFEPWHHSEREKRKAPTASIEYLTICECGHVKEIHRGGFAACTHKTGCPCTSYRQVTKAYERPSPPVSAADEGGLW